jgi:hypothetical protein
MQNRCPTVFANSRSAFQDYDEGWVAHVVKVGFHFSQTPIVSSEDSSEIPLQLVESVLNVIRSEPPLER